MLATNGRAGLSPAECWSRLHTARVGRVSYTERALPVIRAVPYAVDDADGGGVVIAMRVSAQQPGLFDRPTVVAFEAGEWAHDRRAGWSVHFIGKAHRVHDRDLTDLSVGLSSWIDGEPALYVHITVELLDGLQVPSVPEPR